MFLIIQKQKKKEKKTNLAHFNFVGFLLISSFLLIIQLEKGIRSRDETDNKIDI